MTAPGSLYLDPGDGELVLVLPATAWDPDRWGPAAPLPVVRILSPGARDRWTKPGEIAQRDLTGLTLVPPAAVEALRALAGAGGGRHVGIDPGCYGGAVRTLVERGADGGIRPAQPSEPRAAALHACLVCGRHPATHRAGGEDERCQACGLGDEREAGSDPRGADRGAGVERARGPRAAVRRVRGRADAVNAQDLADKYEHLFGRIVSRSTRSASPVW